MLRNKTLVVSRQPKCCCWLCKNSSVSGDSTDRDCVAGVNCLAHTPAHCSLTGDAIDGVRAKAVFGQGGCYSNQCRGRDQRSTGLEWATQIGTLSGPLYNPLASLTTSDHEFHETRHSVIFIVLVNSHQRWKQTRFHVCFHLWCELTLALWCHSIVWSLFVMK